jgi:hypothetical protein
MKHLRDTLAALSGPRPRRTVRRRLAWRLCRSEADQGATQRIAAGKHVVKVLTTCVSATRETAPSRHHAAPRAFLHAATLTACLSDTTSSSSGTGVAPARDRCSGGTSTPHNPTRTARTRLRCSSGTSTPHNPTRTSGHTTNPTDRSLIAAVSARPNPPATLGPRPTPRHAATHRPRHTQPHGSSPPPVQVRTPAP